MRLAWFGRGVERGLWRAREIARAVGVAYRAAVTRGCVIVIALWVAAAALLPMFLSASSGGGSGFASFVPANSRAVQVEKQSLAQFQVPVLSETSVVVHDPHGLSVLTRADVIAWALSYTQSYVAGAAQPSGPHILAAVPIPTATPDTAATYLYVSGASPGETDRLAAQYAAHFANQASVSTFVTGLVPSEVAEQHYLDSRLGLFAAASVAVVAFIVALTFRSVIAPIVVLGVAGLGYVVAQPLLNLLSGLLGFALPPELQPIIVALLLGVVTDYSVLFFSDLRDQVRLGFDHASAVQRTLRREAAIVSVAGLTVAGGTIALLAANLQLFQAFGPALALTVLIGLVVSLTLTPALMTVLGHRLFRVVGSTPHRPRARARSSAAVGLLIRTVRRRRSAAVAALAVVVALLAAASPVLGLRLDVSFTSTLPHGDEVRRGAAVLADSSVRGVTAPTELLVESRHIARRRVALSRLQAAVARQPGVTEVLGPAQNPLPARLGVVLSKDGNAARLIVIFNSDPLGARAISQLHKLRQHADSLATAAGLHHARLEFTGETAIAAELAALTRSNLLLTLLVALGVELVILLLFLRSLLTPIALLACSALGVAAALGLTTWFFQDVRGDTGLTFYAPFATAVLLLALGSDYNVFAIGTIWEEAKRRPLAEALSVAVPRSSRAITVAGFILAATLGMVAIIPLETFREVAFTMAFGLLIDTLLVRPVLTPAVLTLMGRVAGWPSGRIRTRAAPEPRTSGRSDGGLDLYRAVPGGADEPG